MAGVPPFQFFSSLGGQIYFSWFSTSIQKALHVLAVTNLSCEWVLLHGLYWTRRKGNLKPSHTRLVRQNEISRRLSRRPLVALMKFNTTVTWPKLWKDDISPVRLICSVCGALIRAIHTVFPRELGVRERGELLWDIEEFSKRNHNQV